MCRASTKTTETGNTSSAEDIRALRLDKVSYSSTFDMSSLLAPLSFRRDVPSHPTTCQNSGCRDMQVQQLRDLGKDPYAYKFERTHSAAQLQQQFIELPSGQVSDQSQVSIAGRIRARRFMGKLAFATLADDSGEVQLYLEKTALDSAAPDSFKYVH